MTQVIIDQIIDQAVTNFVAIAALGAAIGVAVGLACLAAFSNGPMTVIRSTALGALVLPAVFWVVHVVGPR
jgi:hypothetical protein